MFRSRFLFLFIFIAVCGAPFRAARAEETILVGVIAPLTGPAAEFGIAQRNGLRAFTNSKFRLVFEDSLYDPAVALSVYHQMIREVHPKLILNFGCPTSRALAPVAERGNVPVGLYCSSPGLTKGLKNSFMMMAPATEWASLLAERLAARGLKRLCVVLAQNDYLTSEYNALAAEAPHHHGMSVDLLEQFLPTETDFRTAAAKIRKSQSTYECEALGVYLFPGQVSNFINSLGPTKYPLFGTDIFESPTEAAAAHGLMDGAIYVNAAVPEAFRSVYMRRFGNENQIATACLSAGIMEALAQTWNGEPDLFARLRKQPATAGQCGSSLFVEGEDRFFRFPLAVKTVGAQAEQHDNRPGENH